MTKVTPIRPATTPEPTPASDPTFNELLKKSVYYGTPTSVDYPKVSEGPAFYRNDSGHMVEIPETKTLFDPTNGRIFSPHVTNDYRLIRHEDVVDIATAAAFSFPEYGNPTIDVAMPREGARLKVTFTFTGVSVDIDRGDKLHPTLHAYNSYDTGWALRTAFGAFRVVCTNGMMIGKIMQKYRKEHHQGIDMDDVKQEIVTGMKALSEQQELWKAWTTVRVKSQETTDLLKSLGLLNANGEVIQSLAEMKEITGNGEGVSVIDFVELKKTREELNLWRLYNLLTQYLTHEVKSDIKRERIMVKLTNQMDAWNLKAA